MAVIRAGRTRIIKAGVIGAVIALIPAIIICALLVFFIAEKDAKIKDANIELEKYKTGTVCVLKDDIEKGQEITIDNLEIVKGTFYEKEIRDTQDNYVGMVMKTDAKAGMILNDCIVTAKEQMDTSLRTYYIDYIDVPDGFAEGLCFDIRICFPNGEDYLVAGNKKIISRDEVGFYVDLNRREALLLSSARVDCTIYTGTTIYAAFYSTGFEEDEIQTYPVNNYVFELGQWEPNLKENFSDEMFLRRETLEKNLLDFMGVANNLQ